MTSFAMIEVAVSLWRQAPDAAEGRWEEHRVLLPQGDHLLSLLAAVRTQSDPSLCYPDHFCKIGTCGACALVMDGRPVLGCRATVTATHVQVAPPRGRRILADLLTEEPER